MIFQRKLGYADGESAYVYHQRIWRRMQQIVDRIPDLAQEQLGISIPERDMPAYVEDGFIAMYAWVTEHEILHLVLDEELTWEPDEDLPLVRYAYAWFLSLLDTWKSSRIEHRIIRRLIGSQWSYSFWEGKAESIV